MALCSSHMFTGSLTGSLTSESIGCDTQSIKEKDPASGVSL